MVRTAAISVPYSLASPSPLVLVAEQLHADPQQQQAADDLQVRQRQQLDGHHRERDPHHHGGAGAPETALRCWCGGSERAASAITTALSPDRMMLIQMILTSRSRIRGLQHSIALSPVVFE
jgi:hypothetical protein